MVATKGYGLKVAKDVFPLDSKKKEKLIWNVWYNLILINIRMWSFIFLINYPYP